MSAKGEYVMLPLIRVPDAARYLGVSRKGIYRLIEWGELRAVKVFGSVRIEKQSLDQYKAKGQLM